MKGRELQYTLISEAEDMRSNYSTRCTVNASGVVGPVLLSERIGDVANYIVPVELAIGFLMQLLNLRVLHGNKIRSLTYTVYLKALSFTYLASIPFFIPNMMRKLHLLDTTLWFSVFYAAHLEMYTINVFICSGNLIVFALAVEPLRSIFAPLTTLTNTTKRAHVILGLIYASVGLILIPLTLIERVSARADGTPCRTTVGSKLHVMVMRKVIAPVLELGLVIAITVVYAILLWKFREIVRSHQASVRRHTSTANRSLLGSHRKAVSLAVASVTAYLLSNSLSCSKEVINLIAAIGGFTVKTEEWFRIVFVTFGNMALLFNFTLSVLLHYAFSSQYRAQLHRVFRCRRRVRANGASSIMEGRTITTGTQRRHNSGEPPDSKRTQVVLMTE